MKTKRNSNHPKPSTAKRNTAKGSTAKRSIAKRFGTLVAGGALILTSGLAFSSPAQATGKQIEKAEIQEIEVEVIKEVEVLRAEPVPVRPGGPGDLTNGDDGESENDKYCDGTQVDDDITDCDIGEIAWSCPDNQGPSHEGCTGYPSGSFPD